MSVINQMLKDLDARGGGDAQRRAALASAGVGVAYRPASAIQRQGLKWLYLALLVALGVGAWFLGSALLGQRAQVADTQVVAPAPAPTDAAPEPAPQPSAPAVVDSAPASTATSAPSTLRSEPQASRPESIAEAPPPVRPSEPSAPVAAPAPPPPAKPSRQLIEVLPEGPDALEEVRALLAQGDAGAALARLGGLGATLDAEALALRATAQQQLGQHAAAAKDYSAALAASPEVAAWWVGLGIALEADSRPSEAINAFQQAERRGPLDPALSRYVGGRIEALSNGESTTR